MSYLGKIKYNLSMEIKNQTEIQLMKILFKTNGKRATKKATSTRAYPHGVEQKYYRQLKGFFKPLTDYVTEYINKNLEPLLRGDSSEIHLDAIPGKSFRGMVYNLEKWLSLYMPDISQLPETPYQSDNIILVALGKTADEAMEFGEEEFKKMLEKGIHVNLPTSADWWEDMKKSWAEDNYTLITSNAKNYVSKINTLTEQAIVNGLSPGLLKEEIMKATEGLSEKHCKLLARDQMGKLNGQITQAQMEEVGLDLYVWSTAYDDRVRDSHAVMEGLLCRWDDASVCSYDNGKTWVDRPSTAVQLHPGQDIQCRCVGLAFYPELISEIEDVPMSEIVADLPPIEPTPDLQLYEKNFVKTGWRVDEEQQMQPKVCKDLDKLYEKAGKAHPEFSDFTKAMVADFKDFDLRILERPELKGAERIKEKLLTDQLDFERKGGKGSVFYNIKTDKPNCRYILDIDGNTIVVNNVNEVQEVLKKYSENPAVLRIKNNFAKPSPVGYSDINMNIRMKNGIIGETQINTVANIVAKEYGHSLYEVYRSINNNLEYSHLSKIMGDAQKKLYKMSNELSKNGRFPKVTTDIFKYKYKPYENAIEKDLKKAIPEYLKAKEAGLLGDKTIEHFEELCKKIGVKIL